MQTTHRAHPVPAEPDYKELIQQASERVYQVARRTSLDYARALSQRQGNKVWLKREDQQPVYSYKLRGAYNLIASLSAEERARGVIAASAGNHAQGVALSAHHLDIQALIVMPCTTPEIKITAVRQLQAEVILHGDTYDEAAARARELARERGCLLIPPYDHPLVIAGQGTVGVELLEQHDHPDLVFVPVGGGGLIAGIASWLKARQPRVRIIGVEPDEAPCMHRALQAGEPVQLEQIGIFADGAAVSRAGAEPFRIVHTLVEEIVLVNVDEICAAVRDIFEDTRSVPEPAGALALAGLKKYVARERLQNKELVAIFSGANVNFDRLRHIAELASLGEQQEALFAATVPERPGSFQQFCQAIGDRQLTEFNYRYADRHKAQIFAGVRLRHGIKEKNELLENLERQGYPVVDLSDNELATMHVRYAIGGRAPQVENERLYRFEFPERAGALLDFLRCIGSRWNISLFHYRNHGAAYGRVIAGLQVPPGERRSFRAFLDELAIQHWEETENPAYHLFLR